MGQTVTCEGTIEASPSVTTDGAFPAGSTNLPFTLSPPAKSFNVDTGRQLLSVNSPGSFTAVGAIGTGGAVTTVHTLYARSGAQMTVQYTQLNPGGSPVVQTATFTGLFVIEPSSGCEITAVAFKGSGIVEMYAAGNA